MLTRRRFVESILRDSSLVALATEVPGFLASTARATSPEADGRVLVVVQLDGGNDGLNTVVPHRDDGYARNRKALRLDASKLIRANDSIGLHPSLAGVADLLNQGSLAIVQGVGYPNPSRSHFRSMAVWHAARTDPEEHDGPGWIGRTFDGSKSVASYYVGDGQAPAALIGRRSAPATLDRLDDLVVVGPRSTTARTGEAAQGEDVRSFARRASLDAYAAADVVAEAAGGNRPSSDSGGLASRLALIAGLIKSGSRARVYYTSQGSYDTHADQLSTHASLLSELSRGLKAFQNELESAGLADRVVVLGFSEFGRRVAENGSRGTDHGAAGPVLLMGKAVLGGLIGEHPSLADLDDGDLKSRVDFRRVYAAVLEDWLGIPSAIPLGGRFDPLPLFRRQNGG